MAGFGWWRRLRYGKPVVVVSGLPRSGTSMAMKMLQAGGLEVVEDGERSADEDNPKGYFEDERVKNLAQMDDKSWVRRSRGKAIKVVSLLLAHLPEDNNYQVVFMRRDLDEVLASQAKMLDRRGEAATTSDEELRQMYVAHLDKIAFQMRFRPQMQALEVTYRDVVNDPRGQAEAMNAFLGGALDVDKMVGAVDKSLYRNRAPEAAK